MEGILTAPGLIYMIRNPIERAVSHFIHAWSTGEVRGDISAIFAAHEEFVAYGCYGRQITPFAERFGGENICLTKS